MREYFDDIGLGSYYERRESEDLVEWERFYKMRTDYEADQDWNKATQKDRRGNNDS